MPSESDGEVTSEEIASASGSSIADFESARWDPEGTPTTPAITPGLFTSSERVDTDGNPIVSKLTFGVHWNESSFPAWCKRERLTEMTCALDTPSSILKSNERPHVCQEPDSTPIEVSRIAAMFDDVRLAFGFQFDSEVNIFELLMSQLDSRASRSDPDIALRSLHADYIGGPNSNYRKWYMASQMDLLDRMDDRCLTQGGGGPPSDEPRRREFIVLRSDIESDVQTLTEELNFRKVDIEEKAQRIAGSPGDDEYDGTSSFGSVCDDDEPTVMQSLDLWTRRMQLLSDEDRLLDLIIYLMCWGEANQLRFMPECLDFIFKCARDHYDMADEILPDFYFLEKVITPLYNCYRDFNFTKVAGEYKRREVDHQHVIGYDDMNQLFWYRDSLQRLSVDGTPLLDLPRKDRFTSLHKVEWPTVFSKTYREVRSWFHSLVNFSRIWIIHGAIFWFYTAYNTTPLYSSSSSSSSSSASATEEPDVMTHIRLTIVALGGAIGPLVTIFALLFELWFVPRRFPGAEPVLPRLFIVLAMLLVIIAPSVYILVFTSSETPDTLATVLAGFQLALAIMYTCYFGSKPLGSLLGAKFKASRRRFLANEFFTADFQHLCRSDQSISWITVVLVFSAKLTESYFFLTLSLKDPVRELSLLNLDDKCVGDLVFGAFLCHHLPKILLAGILVTDMVLFFLDTYLWYVIINTLVSIIISFYGGASVWTPWRNIYSRLPQRIKSKMLTSNSDQALKMLWNSIIESMFEEHLLTWDQAKKLMYTLQRTRIGGGDSTVVEPAFFTSEEDRSLETSIFNSQCEAHRRISFFAQSLATPIPEPLTVQQMPAFTVLIPHYSEKIFLTLRETIRQDNEASQVTILEYLQRLYPTEWDCFVKKSRDIASRYRENLVSSRPTGHSSGAPQPAAENIPFTLIGSDLENEIFDIPFKKLGFVTSLPVETNRVRLWGSTHTQTLYRTINGFMKYATAIKVLCFSENDAVRNAFLPKKDIVHLIESLVTRKFRLLVAMQKFDSFTDEERSSVIALLQQFPNLSLVYVEEVKGLDDDDSTFYSTLLDSTCVVNGTYREPRLRVRISGNPILGDGKSDNQNHSLIYYRGEYIQLVDSNQDNYLEECIKIRNVLMEFEERELSATPYGTDECRSQPVAIVGAREYIFSENIGVLGDVAAGKEQTFGTLSARTLAKIGSKLHYGHPDFLNAIFMTTRGGVSKAQKGLHLNEDIYAGMTALCRGGRIKHSEYVQCGKGRDLGFVSILNFTAKIGAGMGEQMLSREYFYLGTRLPIDRFLSFYYAHPGFHLNNVFIMLSLEMFLSCLLVLASIRFTSTLCDSEKMAAGDAAIYDHCRNLLPLIHWVNRCVLSIFLVFFITLLPLFVQELAEKGLWRSISRIGHHFMSFSMLFEIFVCRVYARSFIEDLTLGGAKYIATGRGFATSRVPFYVLYSGYATSSLYFGLRSFLTLLYVSIVFWHPSLLWFWITSFALLFSPIMFNPHQFLRTEFFLDYGQLVKWFSRIGEGDSWQAFVRSNNGKLTGFRADARTNGEYAIRPHLVKIFLCRVLPTMLNAFVVLMPYVYVSSQRISRFQRDPIENPVLRIALCVAVSYAVDAAVLLVGHVISVLLSILLSLSKANVEFTGSVIATTIRMMAVFAQSASLALLYCLEQGSIRTTLLGCLVIFCLQNFINTFLIALVSARQRPAIECSLPWWTGNWKSAHLGLWIVPTFFNEFMVKTVESSQFVIDFFLCHLILVVQAPLLLVPYINKVHSLLLLWLSPTTDFPVPFHCARKLRHRARKYFALFLLTIILLVGLLITPLVVPGFVQLGNYLTFLHGVVSSQL